MAPPDLMGDRDVLEALADVLLNLAAGWFGTLLIAPPLYDFSSPAAALLLAGNALAGIVSVVLSIRLRRFVREIL